MIHRLLHLLSLLVLITGAALTQPSQEDLIHQTTLRGVDSLYNLRLDGAEAAFDEVITMAPDDPRGWFFKSMVSFYVYQLTQDQGAYDRFFELSETVIEKAEEIVDEDESNLTAKFYLGGIYGYRGLAFQRNGNLLSSLWDGRKGYGYLREAATGPNFSVDAKLGFGLFTYLVSKIPRSFSWVFSILGFTGDLEGGLDMIRSAADSGIYTRTEASFYYAQFCFFEQRYDTAYAYMQRIIDDYPRNSLFLVTFAAWELRQDRIERAIEIAERAIVVNRENEIRIGDEFAHSTLAAAYYSMNDFPTAVSNWEQYIELTENKENISNYARYRLGIAYEILGDRGRAMEVWRAMKESTDEDRPWESVYWRRAQVRLDNPMTPADVLLVLGSNKEQAGNRDEATRYYNLAEDYAGPDDEMRAMAKYAQLNAAYSCRDDATVIANAPGIIQLNPQRESWVLPHTLYILGRSYQRMDRMEEALQAFEQASAYDDYDWVVRLSSRIDRHIDEIEEAEER